MMNAKILLVKQDSNSITSCILVKFTSNED